MTEQSSKKPILRRGRPKVAKPPEQIKAEAMSAVTDMICKAETEVQDIQCGITMVASNPTCHQILTEELADLNDEIAEHRESLKVLQSTPLESFGSA